MEKTIDDSKEVDERLLQTVTVAMRLLDIQRQEPGVQSILYGRQTGNQEPVPDDPCTSMRHLVSRISHWFDVAYLFSPCQSGSRLENLN